MSVVAVVGAQWGDEGKGKVVDLYAQHADVIVRYGGGANAGHTLVVDGEKLVFHLVPSGALHHDKECVIGQGTVIDPHVLVTELAELKTRGLLETPRILVSDRAHVVMPHHIAIDHLRDRGAGAIGTTKRGIGPAYEDKAARRGVRVGDLFRPARLQARVSANIQSWLPIIQALGGETPDLQKTVDELVRLGEILQPHVIDSAVHLYRAVQSGRRVLLEGAQGTLLDIDHGTYPFVTSSNVVAGGATAGSGIPPTAVSRVVGIAKAYTTRVGGGPFPTELTGPEGERLRESGQEYGATTGRPRRCGWLDAVALRFAARVNGAAEMAVTKLDVLSAAPNPRICVAYELEGNRLEDLPYDELDSVEPVYETLEGWSEDLSRCRTLTDLPTTARRYLARLEEVIECPVGMIGVGADRDQVVDASDPFAA